MTPLKKRILFVLTALLFSGCAGTKLKLKNWEELPDANYTIPPYSKNLQNYKIALDPGHGGNALLAGYKRGPTGKRESIMNLKVALLLKEFLELAGAEVVLTRKRDEFISLQDRAEFAEMSGCDFMISLHHNAGANPQANYAAIFYHLTPDHSPLSMDLARNIYFGLVESLRLPQVLEDGLLSDRIIYPAGFGLLRSSKIPAILLESSFYSNRKEEKRLTELSYNRREAYGIFLGLARWAAGGVPKAVLKRPVKATRNKRPVIEYQLSDGITERVDRRLGDQLIYSTSVVAEIDNQKVTAKISKNKRYVTFQPDSLLQNGRHTIRVNLQNMYKNHNIPHVDTLIVAALTDTIQFLTSTTYLPADDSAMMPIKLTLLDEDNDPVWDSTNVEIRVNRGSVYPAKTKLQDGQASVYFQSDNKMGLVYLIAQADAHADTLLLSLTPKGQVWTISGAVRDDSTNAPLAEASVFLNDSTRTLTDENGVYFFLNPPVGHDTLRIEKLGYHTMLQEIDVDSMQSTIENFKLVAVLGGLLHGKTIILDPASDDSLGRYFPATSNNESNFDLTSQLAEILRFSGVDVVMVRDRYDTLSTREKIQKVNRVADGWYLKLSYELWEIDSLGVQATIYPANKMGKKIGDSLISNFGRMTDAGGLLLQNTTVPEVTLTNKTALELKIKCQEPNIVLRDLPAVLRGIVEFYRNELEIEMEEMEAEEDRLSDK